MENRVMRVAAIVAVVTVGSTALCADLPRHTPAQPTGMVTRAFDVMPTCLEKVKAGSGEVEGGGGDGGARVAQLEEERTEIRALFEGLGVPWPEGSSIRYMPSFGKLFVRNTPENMAIFEKVLAVLNVVPNQIEVEVQFVEFSMADIDALARNGTIDAEALSRLREGGKARLLFAPKIVTQSGQEATVKGCTEVIYPTTFSVYSSGVTNTNDTVEAVLPVAEPGGFETREVGAFLTVLPELAADGSMINLTLTANVVYDPVWRNYGSRLTAANGSQRAYSMQEPLFFSQNITQSVGVFNGRTVLLGGGLPCSDKENVAYIFITVQQIDIEGRDIERPSAYGSDQGGQR